jgi:hypothetical protein
VAARKRETLSEAIAIVLSRRSSMEILRARFY